MAEAPDYGLDTDQTRQKYHCTLRFMKYSRPKPFSTVTYEDVIKYVLPLPQTINDNTTVDWTNANLDVVGDIINGSPGGAAASALYRNVGTLGNLAATSLTKAIGSALGGASGAFAGAITAATGAVDKILPAEQIQNATEAAFGVAPNPNATLMFKGPELRKFQFRWIFYPKNKPESDKIHEMIRNIKAMMLPEPVIAQSASLLRYPKMCLINFYPWDSMGDKADSWGHTSESIVIIKRCAVTACNVNYNPGVTPNFFAGTSRPTIIEMVLELNELEYVTSEDWGGYWSQKIDRKKGIGKYTYADSTEATAGLRSESAINGAGVFTGSDAVGAPPDGKVKGN